MEFAVENEEKAPDVPVKKTGWAALKTATVYVLSVLLVCPDMLRSQYGVKMVGLCSFFSIFFCFLIDA